MHTAQVGCIQTVYCPQIQQITNQSLVNNTPSSSVGNPKGCVLTQQ